ncbi:hypothetical protein NSK_003706 [Nannochloropsis salina CCMP1776]|uniref:Uncharacterized protein n=1 Tax=Nannochloropsis salina CCMP1776 TaxID=1027361 RepID=A0A4D9D5M6_9STRA|nr:hypothetical protein NSK_003706 [Nannochloropsis salina CCMP1776]|eukprot:TFJ85283.1 hypothetical protein NSK_003706 [Nannochloropsis salina CCMP1776]
MWYSRTLHFTLSALALVFPVALAQAPAYIYGINNDNDIVRYDPYFKTAGTVMNTTLTTYRGSNAAAFDSNRSLLYWLYQGSNATESGLYVWKQITGAYYQVTPLVTLLGNEALPMNAAMYTFNGTDYFTWITVARCEINFAPITYDANDDPNGTANVVKRLLSSPCVDDDMRFGDIAIDQTNGDLYGVPQSGALFRVPALGNGLATSASSLTFINISSAGLSLQLSFDCEYNTLYGQEYDPSSLSTDNWYVVNTATGSQTVIPGFSTTGPVNSTRDLGGPACATSLPVAPTAAATVAPTGLPTEAPTAAETPTAAPTQAPAYIYGINDDNDIVRYDPYFKTAGTVMNTTLTTYRGSNAAAFDSNRSLLYWLYQGSNATESGLYVWKQITGAYYQVTPLVTLLGNEALPMNAAMYTFNGTDYFTWITVARCEINFAPITYDANDDPNGTANVVKRLLSSPCVDDDMRFGDIAIDQTNGDLYGVPQSGALFRVPALGNGLATSASSLTFINISSAGLSLQLSFDCEYNTLYGQEYDPSSLSTDNCYRSTDRTSHRGTDGSRDTDGGAYRGFDLTSYRRRDDRTYCKADVSSYRSTDRTSHRGTDGSRDTDGGAYRGFDLTSYRRRDDRTYCKADVSSYRSTDRTSHRGTDGSRDTDGGAYRGFDLTSYRRRVDRTYCKADVSSYRSTDRTSHRGTDGSRDTDGGAYRGFDLTSYRRRDDRTYCKADVSSYRIFECVNCGP